MQMFPGRFLEEIEQMADYPRIIRSTYVEAIMSVERKREAILKGATKTPEEKVANAIEHHEELLAKYGPKKRN